MRQNIKILLDTGCGRNVCNKSRVGALSTDPIDDGFDLLLFKDPNGEELTVHNVSKGTSLKAFIVGTGFLRRYRAVCDLRAMELYVLLGNQYYCIDL